MQGNIRETTCHSLLHATSCASKVHKDLTVVVIPSRCTASLRRTVSSFLHDLFLPCIRHPRALYVIRAATDTRMNWQCSSSRSRRHGLIIQPSHLSLLFDRRRGSEYLVSLSLRTRFVPPCKNPPSHAAWCENGTTRAGSSKGRKNGLRHRRSLAMDTAVKLFRGESSSTRLSHYALRERNGRTLPTRTRTHLQRKVLVRGSLMRSTSMCGPSTLHGADAPDLKIRPSRSAMKSVTKAGFDGRFQCLLKYARTQPREKHLLVRRACCQI